MQKWMDSVPGQTFLNYAYSWGAAVVILGTLFKLTHLPGANLMLFIGMGTEVVVFFISAFDRPFDKTTIDMTLDNHMEEGNNAESVAISGGIINTGVSAAVNNQEKDNTTSNADISGIKGGTVIIGNGVLGTLGSNNASSDSNTMMKSEGTKQTGAEIAPNAANTSDAVQTSGVIPTGAPAPAVSQETADAMEEVTQAYIDRLNELNETLEKVSALSQRLSVDSEEMENLNRTLTGIARVYEMQLKSASQQITTQDSINEQTNIMANKIKELNGIYSRMIDAMTVNMPKI